MKHPFKTLREVAVNVAETIGDTLEEPCSLSSEGYEFDKYAFHLHCRGVDFELSISNDDLDEHFGDGAP